MTISIENDPAHRVRDENLQYIILMNHGLGPSQAESTCGATIDRRPPQAGELLDKDLPISPDVQENTTLGQPQAASVDKIRGSAGPGFGGVPRKATANSESSRLRMYE